MQTSHELEQFRKHRALRTSSVSQEHNIFAVMEDGGKSFLISLMAVEGGGICGVHEGAKCLEEWKGGG